MTPLEFSQFFVAALAVIGGFWGFYTGWLPRWLRRQIGFYELKTEVERVENNTSSLKSDHEKTRKQLDTLKAGQVAIAESVANDHDVNAEALRDQHFGDGDNPGDFLRSADD